jgi:predicted DNA-binding transcriptional regulator AlpA
MAQKDDEKLLSRDEVQERFGISKRFLEIAAARGAGPRIVRFGRSVRYRVADVQEWIEACADGGDR